MNNSNDISAIVAAHLCHSCGACFCVCGSGAIHFVETAAGYIFPQIDYSACTNCGLCHKVCSGHHFGQTLKQMMPGDPFIGQIHECQVGVASSMDIYKNSQSGGVVTAILAHLLETKKISFAIVAIMTEQTPPRGDVIIARTPHDLLRAQKSKYTPIPLLRILPQIKNTMGPFALVGLPCHLHSLQNLCDAIPWLAKKQIIRIGLICDRTMTAKAIDFIGQQATQKPIKQFIFRDKTKPSYPGHPYVVTADLEEFALNKSVRMAMKDFFTPLRCRLCFDKLNIFADIVCGDPHGLEGIDRERGETLVLTRTERGKKIIEHAKQAKAITLNPCDEKLAIKGQGIEKKRKAFSAYMTAWKTMGYSYPDYPLDTVCKDYDAHKTSLEQILSTSRLGTEKEVLTSAQKHYETKLMTNNTGLLQNIVRKLCAGGKRILLQSFRFLQKNSQQHSSRKD